MYDLVFVEPGPLPPHERTWRHPSELGPTKVDVDAGSGGHMAALAVGTFAVVALAVAVVVLTPRPTTSPTAISVTTAPMTERAVVVADSAEALPQSSRTAVARSTSAVLLTAFAAIPHAVSATPQLDLDGADIADRAPTGGDIVLVRTEDVTHRLAWAQVPMLDLPDGAVIFDTAGDLLARTSHGELLILVDD